MLEQILPRGPDYPFARTMLKHFQSQKSPLLSVEAYPKLQDQEDRFCNLGFDTIDAQSLWETWSSPDFFSPRERIALQNKEFFDEWEGFALFAAHYFFLEASKSGFHDPYQLSLSPRILPSNPPLEPPESGKAPHRPRPDVNRCSPPRIHGSLYQVQKNVFEYHGGYDGHSRVSRTDTYVIGPTKVPELGVSQDVPGDRLFHTITTLNDRFDCLLVGGRRGPEILWDCWLRRNGKWSAVDPLPRPLYRHTATTLKLDADTEAVLVYGGKSSHTKVSDAWLLWQGGRGWTTLELDGSRRPPRFGATIGQSGSETGSTLQCSTSVIYVGVLYGGLAEDGTIVSGALQWTIQDSRVALDSAVDCWQDPDLFDRFGAKTTMTELGLFIVGGLTKKGLPAFDQDVDIAFNKSKKVLAVEPNVAELGDDAPGLLMGHSIIWDGKGLAIVGGGATCFTFGSHMNSTITRVYDKKARLYGSWKLIGEANAVEVEPPAKRTRLLELLPQSSNDRPPPTFKTPTRDALNDMDFQSRISVSKPHIFERVQFGQCVQKWTTQYLKRTIGEDRILQVHECANKQMAFQSKNFRIKEMRCGDFIDSIVGGHLAYFRAVGMQDKRAPAKLRRDFPNLDSDFLFYEALNVLDSGVHSSVLRISGKVNMWLHYDVSHGTLTVGTQLMLTFPQVMPNVLFQIRGSKRVILFPPSDAAKLEIPAGASSSNLDVFAQGAFQKSPLAETSPYEVILKAGEMLFIPDFWCHAVSPLDGFSVAVNVFFARADENVNAKDTWGNKDPQGYVEAREHLAKALRSCDGLPMNGKPHFLPRLAREFLEGLESRLDA